METIKEIGKVISDIALAIFIFIIIPIILFILISSRSNILFGIRSYIVQTGSMKPVIPVGSIIFTKKANSYAVGQVITFTRNKLEITHRIISVVGGKFQTKGDANNTPDPQFVNKSDIQGEVFLMIPYLGLITMFIKTIPGFLLVIVLPNLVFISFEIWNIKEEYRKHIEKKILKELKEVL